MIPVKGDGGNALECPQTLEFTAWRGRLAIHRICGTE